MLSVPDRLTKLSDLYRERNKVYGNDYKRFGKIMAQVFPDGVALNTEKDFQRFAIYLLLSIKMNRYASTLSSGGHADSLDDITVYAQMLAEIDDEKT